MSKVSEYLNEHLQGEVTTNSHVRELFSTDGSILKIIPDIIAYPRLTSDLRKIARFAWQLAEKGHVLPITPRGSGSDTTGAAIGSGLVIDTTAHMNSIFELDNKQKLIRLQPGVSLRELNVALKLQSLSIPSLRGIVGSRTIGGAIANNASGIQGGKYGTVGDWVSQIEVVLANGEVLQTGRVNKRELGRKKGLQTFEGEIYRSIDNLLTDKASLIDNLVSDVRDNTGYDVLPVKRKDGSIDLTSLFIGSQGTLGIISEVIMNTDTVAQPPLVGAFAFADYDAARDGLDLLRQLNPSVLELIDGKIFEEAAKHGKRFQYYADAQDAGEVGVVVVAEFDDGNDHAKKKIAKRIAKLFKEQPVFVALEREAAKAAELQLLLTAPEVISFADGDFQTAQTLLGGAYVPLEQFGNFVVAVADLESKYHLSLPLYGHAIQNVYRVPLLLSPQKAADRQKMLKLLTEWSAAVLANGGHIIGENGEGRLKAGLAYKALDDDVKDLNTAIRQIFDPQGILNTGVKQPLDPKKLASQLRTDDGSDDSVLRTL